MRRLGPLAQLVLHHPHPPLNTIARQCPSTKHPELLRWTNRSRLRPVGLCAALAMWTERSMIGGWSCFMENIGQLTKKIARPSKVRTRLRGIRRANNHRCGGAVLDALRPALSGGYRHLALRGARRNLLFGVDRSDSACCPQHGVRHESRD
jgi:hypothetical protein